LLPKSVPSLALLCAAASEPYFVLLQQEGVKEKVLPRAGEEQELDKVNDTYDKLLSKARKNKQITPSILSEHPR